VCLLHWVLKFRDVDKRYSENIDANISVAINYINILKKKSFLIPDVFGFQICLLKVLVIFLVIFFVYAKTFCQQSPCLSDHLSKSYESDKALSQGVFEQSSKWLPGQTIIVSFLDRNQYLEGKVKEYVKLWSNECDINFEFTDQPNADIRIRFVEGAGSWSFVGKTSLHRSCRIFSENGHVQTSAYEGTDGASMNFGWLTIRTPEEEIRRVILHEFGHALGLLHEHQNASSPIVWNIPVALNYYVNELGWSKEMFYEDIVRKYGDESEYSNKKYDRFSVMHYYVPAQFTKNGDSVGWNTNLSQGDKEIIREMYPRTIRSLERFQFTNIETKFDVERERNGVVRRGMIIKVSFEVANGRGINHRLTAYFQDDSGNALEDRNGIYATQGNKVAVGESFRPSFNNSRYTDQELFIPYDEFHLPCGEHKLSYRITCRNEVNGKMTVLANSGNSYFTFWECSAISNFDIDMDLRAKKNNEPGIKIYPKLKINKGRGREISINCLFYKSDGTPLKDFNNRYRTVSGNVGLGHKVYPESNEQRYNLGLDYDFYLFIPYSELHLNENELHSIYALVVVKDGDRVIVKKRTRDVRIVFQ